MRTPLKKACIFGLACGLGEIVFKQIVKDSSGKAINQDEQVLIDNAILLTEQGQEVLNNSHIKKDRSLVRDVDRNIDRLVRSRDEFNIVELLSVLLLGVQDLEHYANYPDALKELSCTIQNLIYAYNAKENNTEDDEHEVAYARYQKWIGEE